MSHNQRIFLLQAQWYLKMKCHYLNETKKSQDIEDQNNDDDDGNDDDNDNDVLPVATVNISVCPAG